MSQKPKFAAVAFVLASALPGAASAAWQPANDSAPAAHLIQLVPLERTEKNSHLARSPAGQPIEHQPQAYFPPSRSSLPEKLAAPKAPLMRK